MNHMEERKHLFEKIKEHKTEIIVADVTLISLAGVIIIAKNWDSIKGVNVARHLIKGPEVCVSITSASKLVQGNVTSNLSCNKIVNVSDHIRNLSAGRNASAAKLAAAAEHGYNLLPNQTWVIPYTKMCA